MKDEVGALLEVQADDLRIYGLEDRLNALAPRLAALEGDRKRAEEALGGYVGDVAPVRTSNPPASTTARGTRPTPPR